MTIEVRAEMNVWIALPQRDRELVGALSEDRADDLIAMDVLMGVNMRGIPANQSAEGGKLARYLIGHS
jgi:hypothetical protein